MGNSNWRIGYALLAVALAAVILGGCKPRSHTRQEWLNPQYKNADTFHGSVFLSASRPLCAFCHGRNLEGRKIWSIEVPGCSTCHFGPAGARAPSGASWDHVSAGHYMQEDSGGVCDACHQLYKSYGLEPQSCHGCHAHVTGQPWLDPKSPQYHGKSGRQCSTCHEVNTTCATCHFGPTGSKAPDGSGWTHGTIPHNSLEANGAVCNQCHSLERSYDNGPASCHDCHMHVKGQPWMDSKNPGYHGTSTIQCSSCHDNPEVITKCVSCHYDATTGSKTPDPSWTHGTTPHDGFTPDQAAVCANCHMASRSYGNGPAACHDCHIHDKGQPWMDSKNPGYHGTSTIQCSSCHDNPAVTTKCVTCHYDSTTGSKTPDPSWAHGAIPHDKSTLTITPSQTLVCASCHTASRSYDNGPATCHDCHTHEKGQPWMDKNETGYHGASVGGDAGQCSQCHANPAVTTKCANCHFDDATGSKTPDPGWAHGTTPHDGFTPDQAAVCANCHTASRSYGNGPAVCHDCHTHEKGQPWMDSKNPDYHGASSIECSSCHNNPAVTTKCASCHYDTTTGSKTPDPAWSHGSLAHDNSTLTITPAQTLVCANCHTASRSYGNGPELCHDCHTHVKGQPWMDKREAGYHGDSVGGDAGKCSQCHANPVVKTKCASCHFDDTTGSKTPDPSWTHGATSHNGFTPAQGVVCANCHAASRSYGNGPALCHDCHTHVKGQPWMDSQNSGYHGTSTIECSSCHNNPAVTTKCASCHYDSTTGSKTPDPSWTHGSIPHDNSTLTLTPSQTLVCANCHAASRSYGNGPVSCHDCHTHVKGQPWMDRKNPDYHGTSAIQCSSCHDNPAVKTKCASCHFDDTTGSKTPDPGWAHGMTPHDNATLILTATQAAVCVTCHEASRSYGNGPEACHDCHKHPRGRPWLDYTSSEFHGTSTMQCSQCHNLSTECITCHFGSSGSMTPDSGWTHGDVPHDETALTITPAQQTVCANCHALDRSYGNGPAVCHDCHIHELPFTNHGATAKQNLILCNHCHANPANAGPGSNPRYNVPRGTLAAGCESSGCHMQKTAHPVPWRGADQTSHQTAGNMENACVLCHGATLAGGAGPACSTCHTQGLPTVMKNCTSCHGKPPSTGRHSKHNGLPEVTNGCSTCHSGAGSQTASHKNGTVDVSIAGFNAKSGTASFSTAAKTCSNVSCHGGQVTPRWDTGAIDVNTQCSKCHSNSTTQYNSYRSGEHSKHVSDKGFACTECHDTTKLATVHFNDLATTGMTQASLTIRADRSYNGSSCLFICHYNNNNEQHDLGMKW